jgi:F0F1-type ATP synthase epsilon subunit
MKTDIKSSKTNKPSSPIQEGHIKVKIYSPFKVFFNGLALSLSAVNDTGPFDILPMHHKFITLLNNGDIVVRTDKSEERIAINSGIMQVKENNIIIFLDV